MQPFESSTPWYSEDTHEEAREYGGESLSPEESVIFIQHNNHKHFFIRKDARTVGCRDCDIYWYANELEMRIVDGQVVEFKGQKVEEPLYS